LHKLDDCRGEAEVGSGGRLETGVSDEWKGVGGMRHSVIARQLTVRKRVRVLSIIDHLHQTGQPL
jgi:hypothetical protein